MLTKEEVQHIADLARIELSEKEIEKYQGQLGKILDYMEKLKEIDTTGAALSDGGNVGLENVWREDEVRTQNAKNLSTEDLPKGDKTQEEYLISMAPEVEKGQVKVKSVFS